MAQRFSCFLVFTLMFVLGAGCGGGSTAKEGTGSPTENDTINDLKSLLESAKAAGKKAPANKNELMAQYDATNPVATSGIARGMVVYYYGQGLTGGPNIIAYDAKCESNGGAVLLQDGTVKNMTADEFKAAPKAKK